MDAKIKKKWSKINMIKLSLFKYSLNMANTINYILFSYWFNGFVDEGFMSIIYDSSKFLWS